ncbi:NUDIX domain-containing protein [Actinokineospora iranica]|uniref:ADP-ribose pyrophosphatase YjhB, NUDIX family n=1 Tax=Actinokineospora iranica TaxID=1271860 RepID=A0A1G6NLP0_9PSEU|nr:NUDIX domain-containing protein [Actinokineospora iranica]SDC68227.1 ADP-ribose pyrophosphatase YjhB, NUDIX family [Actinokineospora iranica]
MSGPRPAVGVGAVLLDSAGRVLLGRRVKAGERETWCLPGGHLEAGETFESAAAREADEEAGLAVGDPSVFALAVRLDGSGVTVGVAGRGGGTPVVREPHVFAEWTWVARDALPSPLFPASAVLLALWWGTAAPSGWSAHRVGPA